MKQIVNLILLALISKCLYSQQSNYKVVEIPGNTNYFASIELSPDGKSAALSTQYGHVMFFDLETKKVTRDIDLGGFKWGAYMSYSADGRMLLLLDQAFTKWQMNKDYPSRVAVLEVSSGNILLDKDNVNHAVISPDSKSLVGMKDGDIIYWNISTGKEEKKFKPFNGASSFALCADGDVIAVAQTPTEDDLKNIPSIRNDKKAIKEALKYRQVAVFYDTKTFKQKFVADDIFDIIFSMKWYPDANTLYLFNAPNSKINETSNTSKRNGYIQLINPDNGAVSRTMYATGAAEPIYKESPDGKYFAVTSQEHGSRVVNTVQLYDRESGNMLKVFKNDFRLFEDKVIGRASFEFLPDHETIVMGYGTKLVLWKFNE